MSILWSLIRKVSEQVLAILTGYNQLNLRMKYLEDAVRKSDSVVEARLIIINGEMGRVDKNLSQVREDIAYIRGKLDR